MIPTAVTPIKHRCVAIRSSAILLLSFLVTALFSNAQVSLKNLRCEMLANPIGIDAPQPRFSWQLESNQRNVVQTSYQIVISSSEQKLNVNDGDVWNSEIGRAHV